MAFVRKTWNDGSSGNTPITAAELNRLEGGVTEAINTPTWINLQGVPVAFCSVWNGNGYPNFGASVTDYRGPAEPTINNNGGRTITGYDQWLRATPTSNATVTQTGTVLGAQGPITLGTYTFTMPTVPSGDTVIFAFGLATSVVGDATHNITFNVADQTSNATRTITPVATAQTATGFSSHVYAFTATTATSGSTVTIVRAGTNTGTGNVRCVPHVMSISGLASPVPTIVSKGSIAAGATHTSPTVTATAGNTVELGFAADRDTTSPTTTAWTAGSADFSVLTTAAYTATFPSHSSALGWNPNPVQAGVSIGGRAWSANSSDGVANADSFGGSWTLGFTATGSSITAARFSWNASTSTWVQI